MMNLLHAKGIRLGVIYNGNGDAQSDGEWMRSALEHLIAVENVIGGAPDQIAFQSWNSYPTRVLPEADDSSFTGFIGRYFRERSKK